MIDQNFEMKGPLVNLGSSEFYYMRIKDADNKIHYFHWKHENEFGKFEQGQYDGWSYENRPFEEKLSTHITINKN